MTTSLERRLEIVNLVGLKGKIHVDELAEYFHVTGATIRADFRFLSDAGFITRAHGFALVNQDALSQLVKPKKEKSSNAATMYEFIAHSIYSELEEKSTIFLDCSHLIRNSLSLLSDLKQSTIVTRDLNLVQSLLHISNAKFFVTGGRVDTEDMKMTGPQMLSSLKKYRFKKSIVKVDGFSAKLDLFSDDECDADLIRLLCELSEQVIIVSESSVFDSNCSFWICEANEINTVITDNKLSQNVVELLQFNEVIILKPN